jgi:hypothetical protein
VTLLYGSPHEKADGRRQSERDVTLWLDVTRALHEAIREQARWPLDPGQYRRAADRVRQRCPTPEALVAFARARSLGNP